MIILGAGLAGCIAGHLFPGSQILEAGGRETVGAHKALLRFRSDAISRITGIPFRRVKVYKSVVMEGHHYLSETPIHLQNLYSMKVIGRLSDRSISDLTPVERWIAPEDFHAQLIGQSLVEFDWPVSSISNIAILRDGDGSGIDRTDEPILSTIPLPITLKLAELEIGAVPKFERAPIFVTRYRVPNCDVHQTSYFPGPEMGGIYRASITGDLLIVESRDAFAGERLTTICDAFGIKAHYVTELESSSQSYGKILPLPIEQRQALLLRLTQERNLYSLGRFAVWRNLLLDDLPEDAEKIRALIRMTTYQRALEGTR